MIRFFSKKIFVFHVLAAMLFVSSCSSLSPSLSAPTRDPAANFEESCEKIIENILLPHHDLPYSPPHHFLSRQGRKWISNSIAREKMAEIKKSLMHSLKAKHRHKVPTYYVINEKEVQTISEQYAKTLARALPTSADKEILEVVNQWIKSFENFPTDIEHLLDERISLQYNLKILKEIKLQNEREVVTLKFQRQGKVVEKNFIFYKSDKNLQLEIQLIKKELKNYDSKLFKAGKLKDRIIRQAILKDLITLVHREVESFGYNTSDPKIAEEFKTLALHLDELLQRDDLQTSAFGLSKLNSKLLLHEIFPLSTTKKIRASIDFAKEKKEAFLEILRSLFSGRERSGPGFFDQLFASIQAISPRQAAIGVGVATVGYIGIDQYFRVEPIKVTECLDPVTEKPMDCLPPADRLKNAENENNEQNQEQEEIIEKAISDPS